MSSVVAALGVSSPSHALTRRAHSGSVRRERPPKKELEPKSRPTCLRHARVAPGSPIAASSTRSAACARRSERTVGVAPGAMQASSGATIDGRAAAS
eukprot:1823479-Prymnesium_polylepis.1